MNWITKFIKPKLQSLFKKKSAETKDSLWTTCSCKNLIYKEDLNSNFNCCPKCGEHHKLTCNERFKLFFDNGDFNIIQTPTPVDDPLNFVANNKKYSDKLDQSRKLTKQNDAIMVAEGRVNGIPVTAGSMDFRFIGGSFGAACGEAFISALQNCIKKNIPLIFFSCSGGQRMQESAIALMQMTRTTLAVNELKNKNIPFLVVLTNPTTGGVTASWASLGDILIAEPKSVIGFAGRRVIQSTVRENLPDEFQTAEYVKDHGGIDLVVERKFLSSTIGTLLSVLLKSAEQTSEAGNANVVQVDKSLQSVS